MLVRTIYLSSYTIYKDLLLYGETEESKFTKCKFTMAIGSGES